jgi:BirA family biotin operon repressor/biotin-[acetyl-CoA-carboxylase] ligase
MTLAKRPLVAEDALAARGLAELAHALAPLWPGLTAECVASIDSTNLELQRRWRNGQRQPQVLVAREQTAGRGRMGRQWHSSPGASLTFSVALPSPVRDWSGLSLMVGLVVAETLHPQVGLKWPNDLWVMDAAGAGQKLGGILIESLGGQGGATEPGCLVIGIGINLETPPDQGLPVPPVGLNALRPDATGPEVLNELVPPLLAAFLQFQKSGFPPFLDRFNARHVLDGQQVTLSDAQHGTVVGVESDGALLLQTGTGLQRVVSGEVSVRLAKQSGV